MTAAGADARGKQARGLRTRARLIAATNQVVAEVGFANATTKAIAEAAGVAEGTIYRHFTDKHHLCLAAVLEANADLVDVVAQLPDRAGSAPVADVLGNALRTLASLRSQLLPIELSLLTQPALRASLTASAGDDTMEPVRAIADYIEREQALSRIRPTLDPGQTSLVLLSTLFGIAMLPGSDDRRHHERTVEEAIDVLVAGLVADR